MKSKKEQKLQYDYSYALAQMIIFPEPLIGQKWSDLDSVEKHIKTLTAILNKGADPTILKRIKSIVNSLPLDK